MGLKRYSEKRNFSKTPEPAAKKSKKSEKKSLIFVVQKHHARNLHYDLRLEYGGTLKSWAVPKGPSLNPTDRRLAVEVEDHPIDYAGFEGEIPKGEYGAGQVIVWDKGRWIPAADPAAALKKGHLDFELKGTKMNGRWTLVRMGKSGPKNNWLLIKQKDMFSRTDYDLTVEEPEGVLKKKSLPEFIKPQLALLVDHVPKGPEWIHELKYDGYRTLCRINGDNIRFLTRSGLDWTSKYQALINSAKKLGLQNAILDGELVVLDEKGRSSFQLLQNALAENAPKKLHYYAFDLLFLNGKNLCNEPLLNRKAQLAEILRPHKNNQFLYSEHFEYSKNLYSEVCRLQLEGVVSKLASAPHTSGRSPVWQKTKCSLRQELIIGGFTRSEARRPFSSILVGYYDNSGKLRYAGKVGTGFSDSTLSTLSAALEKLARPKSPFDINSPSEKNVTWVSPKLVAEIEFKTWTAGKILRQASFQGLRADKQPKEIILEKKTRKKESKITHPDRVVYQAAGITKQEVVDYFEQMAPHMLPYVHDRPLSILRCQQTTEAGCYFQKHTHTTSLVGISSREVHNGEKYDSAISVERPGEIFQLIQAGTVEVHGWQASFSNIDKPDQIIFDLDPESEKLWGRVIDTSYEIQSRLKILGLQSFIKLTGGKGVHIHVPVQPRYSWNMIKAFSKGLMQILYESNPGYYTMNMQKQNRKGKIFLDYLRNGYGATAIIPYSLRARTQPTVAFPIAWKDLKKYSGPDEILFKNSIEIVKKRKDPWADYFRLKQRIAALENHGNFLNIFDEAKNLIKR